MITDLTIRFKQDNDDWIIWKGGNSFKYQNHYIFSNCSVKELKDIKQQIQTLLIRIVEDGTNNQQK